MTKKEVVTYWNTFRISKSHNCKKLQERAFAFWNIKDNANAKKYHFYDTNDRQINWTQLIESRVTSKQSVILMYHNDLKHKIASTVDKNSDGKDTFEVEHLKDTFETLFKRYFNQLIPFFNIDSKTKNGKGDKSSGQTMDDYHPLFVITILCLLILRFYTTCIAYTESDGLKKGFEN